MPFNALLILCFMLLLGAAPGRAVAEDSLMIESRHAPGLQVGQPEYALGRLEAGFDQARSDDRGWRLLQVPNLLRQPAGAWLRFPVHNLQANASSWYLLLKWPVLDRVTLRVYYPRQDRWGEPMVAGDTLAVSQRPVVDHNLVFPLNLQPGEQAVVYLQLEASELMVLPLELVDEKSFIEGKVLDTALFSLFFGGMIVIVLYNLSLLIFTRDLSYLLYVLYLLSAMFYVGTMSGFGQLVLWPGAPPFSARHAVGNPVLPYSAAFRRTLSAGSPVRRLGLAHHLGAGLLLDHGAVGGAADSGACTLAVHGIRGAALLPDQPGGDAHVVGPWQRIGAAVQHRLDNAAGFHRHSPSGAVGLHATQSADAAWPAGRHVHRVRAAIDGACRTDQPGAQSAHRRPAAGAGDIAQPGRRTRAAPAGQATGTADPTTCQ